MVNEQIQFETAQKTLSEKLEQTLNAGEKISKVMNGLEILPPERLLIVKPYPKNPYEKMEIRDSGLIIGGDSNNKFQNPDSGEEEELEKGIIVARVIESGPDCKYVREGDDVYYTVHSQTTLPFFGQGFYSVHETRVLAVINEGLQERFANAKL